MSAPIHVQPESLTRAGAELQRLAEQMATGLQQLQTTVTGSGNPWGGDEQGALFAQAYGLVLGKAIESMGTHVHQVGQAAQGLTQQAALYSDTESGITQQQTSMAHEIEG